MVGSASWKQEKYSLTGTELKESFLNKLDSLPMSDMRLDSLIDKNRFFILNISGLSGCFLVCSAGKKFNVI